MEARDDAGQAEAAVFGFKGDAVPAALGELPVGVLPAVARYDLIAGFAGARLVARAVQGIEDFARERRGLREHRLNRIERRVLVTGKRAEVPRVAKLGENEQHVVEGGLVGHGRALLKGASSQ